jgi:hypothetical protein
MSLKALDEALQQVASALAQAFGDQPWDRLRYASRWTPSGDVGADDFWLKLGGAERKTMPAGMAESLRVSDAAKLHWKLTQELGQARWYRLDLTLERSGQYHADFEYRDDYKEGDIIEPLAN